MLNIRTILNLLNKISKILDKESKGKLRTVFILGVVSAVSEVASVGSVYPFSSILSDPNSVSTNPVTLALSNVTGLTSHQSLLILLGLLAFFFLLLRNVTGLLLVWRSSWFAEHLNRKLADNMMRSYLSMPFSYFVDKNSSDMLRTVTTDIGVSIRGVVLPMVEGTVSLVIALLILTLSFIANPLVCLVSAFIVTFSYVLVYQLVRKRLDIIGKQRVEDMKSKFKVASETFASMKDLKIMGRGRYFIEKFTEANLRYTQNQIKNHLLNHFPRNILESVVFATLLLIVVLATLLYENPTNFIPSFALFAFAIYRLLPTLQSVYSAFSNIKYHMPTFLSVYDELQHVKSINTLPAVEKYSEVINFSNCIDFKNVNFRYISDGKEILKNVTVKISANKITALAGATGGGKTTFADLILGLYYPNSGEISVDGVKITRENISSWRPNVAYVPQSIGLIDDTFTNNIAFALPPKEVDFKKVVEVSKMAKLHNFINTLPDKYETIIGERGVKLSGGQRQRIGIARALYCNSPLLVLDEATSAVDSLTENAILEALAEIQSTHTILLITHNRALLERSDIIILLKDGEVFSIDTYSNLSKDNEYFRKLIQLLPSN